MSILGILRNITKVLLLFFLCLPLCRSDRLFVGGVDIVPQRRYHHYQETRDTWGLVKAVAGCWKMNYH